MKKIILLFVLGLIAWNSYATNKPEYAVFLIDTNLLKNANAVIRNHESIFRVTSPSDATHRVKMVVTRLNEEAKYDGLSVYYNMYSKVKSLEANMYDAQGNLIRKIKKEEIQDFSAVSGGTMYQDNRVKYIDFTYGTYPYTIEYEYEVSFKSIFLYPRWDVQSFYTSTEASSYTLILPKGISFKSKLYNLQVTPKTSSEDGYEVNTWQAANVAAVKSESFVSDYDKLLAMAYFVPSEFEVAGYKGSMLDWQAFGKFIYEINKDRDKLSPAMVNTVKSLTANTTSEEEKVAILYRYMQQNMRYVSVQLGIGGWQTFDANYVEQNKYGDCKALSNFMKAMLKVIDIPAYTVLVYASESRLPYEVEEDFSFPRFNHAILHIPKLNYWLECTSTTDPPNYLGAFTSDRNVLLVTEEGGKLIRTPSISSDLNQKISATEIHLETTGAATIKNSIQYGGTLQDDWRYYFSEKGKEELKKAFMESSDLPIQELQSFEYVVQNDQPIGNLHYTAVLARYASKSGRRLFVPLNFVNAFNKVPSISENRQHPIDARQGYVEMDTITIVLPVGAKVESVGDNFKLATPYGTYELEIQQAANKIICIRKLLVHAMKIPKEENQAWREFYQQVAKKDNSKVVILLNQA